MNKVVAEGRHLLVCVGGGGKLFLPSYATPACRKSRCRCCEISSNTARLRKRIQVKMKKTLLQALKTLKTPRFLVTNNHVCVYVSPNVATSPVSSSGGALLILHEAAMIIYTQRPPDSVSRPLEFAHQGQRCCSNHQGTIMKRTKGGSVMSEIREKKCWGKVRSFASGFSTVFLRNCKKRYAGLVLHQCLYMLVYMLFFFIWCFAHFH